VVRTRDGGALDGDRKGLSAPPRRTFAAGSGLREPAASASSRGRWTDAACVYTERRVDETRTAKVHPIR
jgi:hypothetical protein